MKSKSILTAFVVAALCICAMSINAQTQNEPQTVDEYVSRAKVFIIAECLTNGAINILGNSTSTVKVLQVLKGKAANGEMKVGLKGFSMPLEIGKVYLIRSESEVKLDGSSSPDISAETQNSVVEIPKWTTIDELKKLPLNIAVARIINTRKDDIENQLRRLTYEKEMLEKIYKEK